MYVDTAGLLWVIEDLAKRLPYVFALNNFERQTGCRWFSPVVTTDQQTILQAQVLFRPCGFLE